MTLRQPTVIPFANLWRVHNKLQSNHMKLKFKNKLNKEIKIKLNRIKAGMQNQIMQNLARNNQKRSWTIGNWRTTLIAAN